jgi:hypothetical protein
VLIALGRRDEARAIAASLALERVGWADALALHLDGLAGDDDALRRSVEAFDRHEMALFAAAARLRLGERQGAALGEANVRAAWAWLTAQGVKEPDRLAATLSPRPG